MRGPPKNLVTGVCVLLAAPLAYATYQQFSILAAGIVLLVVGVVIPQVYARIAVPIARDESP